jgi:hypothetical protein
MKLQKFSLIIAIAASLLIPSHVLADGKTSTGYLSSVTSRSLVMEGVSYHFRPNREERNPVKVKCGVKDKTIDCEDLTAINQRNTARAKISFDRAGFVTTVQILDDLK